MKLKVIYKCENCGEIFDGGYVCNVTDETISTALERPAKDIRIHPCQYEVWGVARILRFEGPIVSGEV